MIPVRQLSQLTHVYLILFTSFACSVLQNVTVDDAVLTGPVVPVYLPFAQNWAQGNACVGCAAKPDPSFAYNATWHDDTFNPSSNIYPGFQFTFVGSGLYIFFILANDIGANITTLTNLQFVLDGELQAQSFMHSPTASADYEYNQAVYANDSMTYGQHNMTVVPSNNSVVGYPHPSSISTDETTTTSTDSSGLATVLTLSPSSSSSSSTGSGLAATSSSPDVGAIAGGTVGGVAALALVITTVMCCWRQKRRTVGRPPSPETNVVEPLVLSSQIAPTSLQVGSPPTESRPRFKPSTIAPAPPVQPSDAPVVSPSPPTQSSSSARNAPTNGGDAVILEQEVGMLRDEVARLRRLQDLGWNPSEVGSELPPEYHSRLGSH